MFAKIKAFLAGKKTYSVAIIITIYGLLAIFDIAPSPASLGEQFVAWAAIASAIRSAIGGIGSTE
jgi:hypothetical protein